MTSSVARIGLRVDSSPLLQQMLSPPINSPTSTKTLGSVALASREAAWSSETSPDWGTVWTRWDLPEESGSSSESSSQSTALTKPNLQHAATESNAQL